MIESNGFFESWFVWRDALIVAALSAMALSYLGVWVVLRRAVYLPLALTQVSSAGLVVAFLVADLVSGAAAAGESIVDPGWMAVLFAGLASVWFARTRVSTERLTAVAYLVSAAATLLVARFIRGDLHDVSGLMFGNAVIVETVQVAWVAGSALVVFLVNALCHRRFLFSGFDRDSAVVSGIPAARYETILYLAVALMISTATRAIGALPVFAFTILPAMAGLRVARSMRGAFIISASVGLSSAILGYWLSFVLDLPTGATMAAVASVCLGVATLAARLVPRIGS